MSRVLSIRVSRAPAFTNSVRDRKQASSSVNTSKIAMVLKKRYLIGELKHSIAIKWKSQRFFHRYLNGNPLDVYKENAVPVSLRDALLHLSEWTTDWNVQLTLREAQLIRNINWDRHLSRTRVMDTDDVIYVFRGVKIKEASAEGIEKGIQKGATKLESILDVCGETKEIERILEVHRKNKD